MKEADIIFGARYAVDTYDGGGEPVCLVVHHKLPPKPGATRSRMYVCLPPDRDITGSVNAGSHYDASKIRMPWSEYEKTFEYKERHLRQVKDALEGQVQSAMNQWTGTLTGYVQAATGSSYVSGISGTSADSLADLLKKNMDRYVQTDVKTIVQLAGIPLPDTSAVATVIEQRDEVLRGMTLEITPLREAKLNSELDEWLVNHSFRTADNMHRWISSPDMTEYIEGLIFAEIEGPHHLLMRLAQRAPNNARLKELTENDLFTYLIPHLDFGA